MRNEIEALAREVRRSFQQGAEQRELHGVKDRLQGLIYSNERIFESIQEKCDSMDKEEIHRSFQRARMALDEGEKADLEAAVFELGTISQKLFREATGQSPPPEERILRGWETRRLRTFLGDLIPVVETLYERFHEAVDEAAGNWILAAIESARRALDGIDRAAILAAVLRLLKILRWLDPDDPAAVAVLRWFDDDQESGLIN